MLVIKKDKKKETQEVLDRLIGRFRCPLCGKEVKRDGNYCLTCISQRIKRITEQVEDYSKKGIGGFHDEFVDEAQRGLNRRSEK